MMKQQIEEHGWDFDGRTVVKYDQEVDMYLPVTYRELLESTRDEVAIELTKDMVDNYLDITNRLN